MTAIGAARSISRQLPWALLAALVVVLVLIPIAPLLYQAVGDGGAGFRQLADYTAGPTVAYTTAVLGVGSVVVALLIGIPLALAVNSVSPRIRPFIIMLPIAPLLIPSTAHVTGFVFLLSPEVGYINTFLRETPLFEHLTRGPINIFSLGWIVAYTGFHLTSLVYLFVLNALNQMGSTYRAAALANGSSRSRCLFKVTLPLLRPAIVYSTVVVLLLSLGQLTAPLFLGRRENVRVVATEILRFTQGEPVNFALGAAVGLPLLIAALLLVAVQRSSLAREDRFVGSAGRETMTLPTRRVTQIFAVGFVVLFVLISTILPIIALMFVGVSPFWSGTLSFDNMTLRNFDLVFSDPTVMGSIWTTLRVALMAGLIVTIVGFVVAYVLFNKERVWPATSTILDGAVTVVLAVPAALFGFGFLYAYRSSVGFATTWGLVLAFVVITLPFAVRYQLAGMVSVGRIPIEAARASGASLLRVWTHIIAPLIRTSIAASGAIVLVLLTHEFGTAVMIRSPRTTVMSVKLFDFFTGSLYPRVAVMGLLMTAVTGLVVAVAFAAGSRGRTR